MAAGADETTGRRTRGSAPETRGCGPGPGEAPPPSTPRPAYRAGPGPARFRPGRGRRGEARARGAGGGGDRACGPLLPGSFLRGLGRAAAVCQKQKWPARVPRTHTFAERLCGPRSALPRNGSYLWGAEAGRSCCRSKDLETEDGKAVTRSPVPRGRSCRCLGFLELCANFSSGCRGTRRPLSRCVEELADGR
ncbi:unnamed protein product [Nyctereutes procyonoides]|uniref:(raccoon dog) hypothetical protein n=1 Tax=Nyctereutes procyonoides TaxID=34880 RepID=A0A811ZNT5_NYCPR|nr:unnamed protein product [Nyctereutes procyonoides]